MTYFKKMFLTITTFISIGFIVFGSFFLLFVNQHALEKEMKTAEAELTDALRILNSQMVQVSNIGDNYAKILSDNTIIRNSGNLVIIEEDTIYSSPSFINQTLKDALKNIRTTDSMTADVIANNTYIMMSERTSNGRYQVVYFHDLEPMNQYIDTLNQYYRMSLIVFFAIAMLVSYIIVKFLMNPIDKLIHGIEGARQSRSQEPIPSKDDEFKGVISAFNSMNQEITAHIESIEEKQKLQEMLLLNFAHEIKTPLTSIIGYAQLLELKYGDLGDIATELNYIVSEGYRLSEISSNLMKLQSTDRSILKIRAVDIQKLINDLESFLKSYPNIESELYFDDAYIMIDFELFQMVYRNIIVNAIKADANNIKITGNYRNDIYTLTIQDNGVGIDDTHLENIFEPFFKQEKTPTQHGSTGLGLYIVKRIIDAHEGSIEVESSNQGTCLTLQLKGRDYEETSI